MYAIHIVRSLNKSLPLRLKTVVSSLKCIRRNYKAKQPSSFESRTQMKNDVVLFKLENPTFFIAINIIAALQCSFWTYLGLFLFRSLDHPALKFESSKVWAKILEKEREYSNVLCVISVFFGWAVLFGTCLYSMRSVRQIILHKDGRFVTLVTYNLPGYNTIKIPLNNMSSGEHRTKAKRYIPVKLKNNFFYYLIDIRGEFSDPTLFDFTVGVKRSL